MLKRKFIGSAALLLALFLSFQTSGLAFGKKEKKEVKFKVRIENISTANGLAADDGSKYPFAVSPGMFAVSERQINFFKAGKKANSGLEAQAEDGNPEKPAFRILTIRVGKSFRRAI